jgi:VanZ family protein
LNSGWQSVLRAWIAAILWLVVIAEESSSWLSSHNTSHFLYPFLHSLFGIDHVRFEYWHFYIRKGGHVAGYGILSVLLFYAWRGTLLIAGNPRWALRWAEIAFLMTAFVASLDEWHQTFLPSRTGLVQDVVLDACAGLAAQILIYLVAGVGSFRRAADSGGAARRQ